MSPLRWLFGADFSIKDYFLLPQQWKATCLGLLLIFLLSVSIFFETWQTMVETWMHTRTYNHCFIIAPISLWLIASQRTHYSPLKPSVTYWPVLFISLGGVLWLLGNLSHLVVIKEFAVITMLVAGFWSLLGHTVSKAMLFPLFFLFFMIPVGEELIPVLREFTSSFTVKLIRLSGLPVYREGNFFMLTSGSWSVVEACSGINYLIASITLGFVYAYINYSSYWKRALFIGLSCTVPVIANGFRAYLIVMIGHMSNMKLAVGVDHLVYGSVFFGFVTLMLFYVGSFWRDEAIETVQASELASLIKPVSLREISPILVVIGLVFSIWPVSFTQLQANQPSNELPDYLSKVESLNDWQKISDPVWGWQPEYIGSVAQKTDFYGKDNQIVAIHHSSFGKESQGYELVSSQNSLIPHQSEGNKRWRDIDLGSSLSLGKGVVDETVLVGNNKYLLVVEWYQIGSLVTSNSYRAKWQQLVKRLKNDETPELKVVVWTDSEPNDNEAARTRLQQFLQNWLLRPH